MIRLKVDSEYTSRTSTLKIVKLPGGELHPQLAPFGNALSYTIIADTTNADDLMSLFMVTDAVRSGDPGKPINLVIGYVPYARQDRVSNPGEALSIRAMANLINSQEYRTVTIYDPHSDVTSALINNVQVVSQQKVIAHWLITDKPIVGSYRLIPKDWVLVCPDAGAIKKTDAIAKEFGFAGVVYMEKHRDTTTGKITGILPRMFIHEGRHTPVEELADKQLLVIDDICDGGGTFIGIAESLNKFNPKKLNLFVTHGIFSKGTKCLIDAGYSLIYTTNTYGMHDWNVDSFYLDKEVIDRITETKVVRFQALQ